jgi:hypothetical protein
MTVSIATFMLLRNTVMIALRVAVTDFPNVGVSIAVINFALKTQESTVTNNHCLGDTESLMLMSSISTKGVTTSLNLLKTKRRLL